MLTLSRSHSLAVPGLVDGITGTPYVSQVNLTWEPPLMPNGVIVAYEVSYRRTASSQSETRDNTTALVWASENNLEEDIEFIFSLRAYTRVGPGNYSSLTIATLGGAQSSKMHILYVCGFSMKLYVSFPQVHLLVTCMLQSDQLWL